MFDYLTPEEILKVSPEANPKIFLIRCSDNFPICEYWSEKEAKAICNSLNKNKKEVLKSMIK